MHLHFTEGQMQKTSPLGSVYVGLFMSTTLKVRQGSGSMIKTGQHRAWYDLKQVKINIQGEMSPMSLTKRWNNSTERRKQGSQAGFLRYILKSFGITYEYTATPD